MQRSVGDTVFMQVNLLQLARAIERAALANGAAPEEARFFVAQGTQWTQEVRVGPAVELSGTRGWRRRR